MDSNKETPDSLEHQRLQAEIEKIRAEQIRVELESRQLQENLHKPWYRKESALQAFIAGLVSIPILWFFFNDIIKPMYQAENIALTLENAQTRERLQRQRDSLAYLKEEFARRQAEAATDLQLAWDDIEAVEDKYETLQTRYDALLARYEQRQSASPEDVPASSEFTDVPAAPQEPIASEERTYTGNQMRITDHRLQGDGVSYQPSPNTGGTFADPALPDAIIFHYSASASLEATVRSLTKRDITMSTHLLIDRDGQVVQLVPFNTVAWHTGRSAYGDRTNYNRYAIGITLINAGKLTAEHATDAGLRAWFGKSFSREEATYAALPNAPDSSYWHQFTDVQLTRTRHVVEALTQTYTIRELLPHYAIAPNRKVDPGPLFPIQEFQDRFTPRTRYAINR
jgi:N-acetyl-anhydromuramyl-L-alanine amidase AmpD